MIVCNNINIETRVVTGPHSLTYTIVYILFDSYYKKKLGTMM